jgi:hypothetical protein
LFTLDSSLKTTEVAHISGAAFSHGTSFVFTLTKNAWASFWATSSQTHPVTLVAVKGAFTRKNSFFVARQNLCHAVSRDTERHKNQWLCT